MARCRSLVTPLPPWRWRGEPCVNAEIPGCYPDGLELTIWGAIEHSGTYDWLAVEADGTQGWAVTDYLSFNRAAFPVTCNVPVHPLDTRTGVASVDALIAAVHPGDAQALARNIAGVQVACTLNAQGIGGPPPCEDGESEGTILDVLPSSQCEGFYVCVENVGNSFFALTRSAPCAFAVFEVDARGRVKPRLGAR